MKKLFKKVKEWMKAAWQQVKVKSSNAAVNRDNVAGNGLKIKGDRLEVSGETASSYTLHSPGLRGRVRKAKNHY